MQRTKAMLMILATNLTTSTPRHRVCDTDARLVAPRANMHEGSDYEIFYDLPGAKEKLNGSVLCSKLHAHADGCPLLRLDLLTVAVLKSSCRRELIVQTFIVP